MTEPELPAAADNRDAILDKGLQGLRKNPGASSPYRADFLASGSDTPHQPAQPATTSETEGLDMLNAFLGDEPSAATTEARTETGRNASETQSAARKKLADNLQVYLTAEQENKVQLPLPPVIFNEDEILQVYPDDLIAAGITPNPEDDLWEKIKKIVPPAEMARIEFAVFCRMRHANPPSPEWQKFFDEAIPGLKRDPTEATFQYYEPRIAALTDQETRDMYAALLQLRAENAALGNAPGGNDRNMMKLISESDSGLVRLLFRGNQEVISAFNEKSNSLLPAINRATLTNPNQLVNLAQAKTDEQQLSIVMRALLKLNIPYPESIHAVAAIFRPRIRTSEAYYGLANKIGGERAEYLQKLADAAGLRFSADGLLERVPDPARPVAAPPPAATPHPPTPQTSPFPIEVPPATLAGYLVEEGTPGNRLIDAFDHYLRGQTSPVPIEVFPATLAEYFKRTSKLPFGAGFKQDPNLTAERRTDSGEEAIFASGSIGSSIPGIDRGEVTFNIIIGNSGEGVEILHRGITYDEKSKGNREKAESYFDNLISSIIGSINERLRDKNWQVEGLHIQDGRVRFNFKKKIKGRT